MGKINNQVIEIRNWLNSDRNYNDGVFLYNKYGNNDSLKRIFPGREKFQAKKLAYELAKLAGLSFSDFLKDHVAKKRYYPPPQEKTRPVQKRAYPLPGKRIVKASNTLPSSAG